VSHPAALPDLFIDRSLGRIQVPNLLRAAGLRLVTLAEHYGIPADEEVADTTWLTRVAPAASPDVVEPAAWPCGAWPRLPAPEMESCQMAARGNPPARRCGGAQPPEAAGSRGRKRSRMAA
jgi:hypothetical protein